MYTQKRNEASFKGLQSEHSIAHLSFQSQQLLISLTEEETKHQFIDHFISKDTKEDGVPLVNMQVRNGVFELFYVSKLCFIKFKIFGNMPAKIYGKRKC